MIHDICISLEIHLNSINQRHYFSLELFEIHQSLTSSSVAVSDADPSFLALRAVQDAAQIQDEKW